MAVTPPPTPPTVPILLTPSTPAWLRAVERVAGWSSAGLAVLAAALLGAKVVAPLVVSGATGPLWWRIILTAAAAGITEGLRPLRTRWPVPARAAFAAVVVVAAVTVIAITWWR